MSKKKLQGEIVIEELDKFPNTPTLTLAKKLFKENPKVFMSIESVRSLIRYYRGQKGVRSRGRVSTKEFFKDADPNIRCPPTIS